MEVKVVYIPHSSLAKFTSGNYNSLLSISMYKVKLEEVHNNY